jgi:hypothetical protein
VPEVIVLDSASEIIALGVRPNKSEDLSISEKIWVIYILNDFMASFDTGVPPSEDAQEDASPVIQAGSVQDEPAQVPSVGARGKEPVIESVHRLDPSGSSLKVILEDGLERVLLRVDSPPLVDDVHLVPLGFPTE